MSKHQQKRGRAPMKEADLFDNETYQKSEIERLQNDNDKHVLDKKDLTDQLHQSHRIRDDLQKQLDQKNRDNEALKSVIEGLENEVKRLLALLDERDEKDMQIKFSLIQIVDYCKQCAVWGDASPIVNMLNKFLRKNGTQEDADLVDSIENEFKNRHHGFNIKDSEVTFKDTQVSGSMYEVKNNNQVNLGNKPAEAEKDQDLNNDEK